MARFRPRKKHPPKASIEKFPKRVLSGQWVLRVPITIMNFAIAAFLIRLAVREGTVWRALPAAAVFLGWVAYLVYHRAIRRQSFANGSVDSQGIRGFGLAKTRVLSWSEVRRVRVIWNQFRHGPLMPFDVEIHGPNKTATIPVDAFGGPRVVHAKLAEWCGVASVDTDADAQREGLTEEALFALGAVVLTGLSAGLLTATIANGFKGPMWSSHAHIGVLAGAFFVLSLLAGGRFNLIASGTYVALLLVGQLVVADGRGTYPFGAVQGIGLSLAALAGFGAILYVASQESEGAV